MEPLLQRLDSHDHDMLIANTKRFSVKKGEMIFTEGSRADYLYFIQKGEIRLFKDLGENKEITVFIRGEQDCFGEIGIFSGKKYSNTAKATKDSILLSLERQGIETILGENGKLGLQFTKWVAESLEASKAQTRDFLMFGSEGAVASVFVRFANMYGVVTPNGVRITEPVMIRDVSMYVGISRETVSRIVNKWKSQGILTNDNKYFLVKEIGYLKKLLACDQCGVENCIL
ncbi:cyclic nucleotide-binding domain-containing protein [Virgibacillus dakarensis]|uniref:cAMP-binding protein n=1 Tax=Lentibacillus populi TaxID=1827502 RepID=A0A9W5U149_9BACI|nr:Crp/Fnr family transcriptional regulator [Lentibacillus populi]MTW86988.1 cyclic nucleotide-binding domain-containing protein [Virgibacillus dakarensis]GGB55784.1 cAMP-binding protein [Lentibacillus populi]